MTDAQYKECTAKIKAMADIRPLAVDDGDSIIRAFHRSIKLGKTIDPTELLPNITAEEKAAILKKAEEESGVEKRTLNGAAESNAKRVAA